MPSRVLSRCPQSAKSSTRSRRASITAIAVSNRTCPCNQTMRPFRTKIVASAVSAQLTTGCSPAGNGARSSVWADSLKTLSPGEAFSSSMVTSSQSWRICRLESSSSRCSSTSGSFSRVRSVSAMVCIDGTVSQMSRSPSVYNNTWSPSASVSSNSL